MLWVALGVLLLVYICVIRSNFGWVLVIWYLGCMCLVGCVV